MKKIFALAVIAASFMMTSCSSHKNTASVSDYQYYKQQQQQQQTQAEQRPTRTLRQRCNSEILATEDCDKWRALGTSTSYVEKVARNEAARDARNQLAQMMKVAVEGAAQDYEQNAQKNMKSTAASLGEAVMSQFVAEEVENTKIIASDVFDLSDGSVQVYVCIEIRDDKESFAKKLNNTLERDGLIEIQYDRDRFIKKMADGLEEYKKKNAN